MLCERPERLRGPKLFALGHYGSFCSAKARLYSNLSKIHGKAIEVPKSAAKCVKKTRNKENTAPLAPTVSTRSSCHATSHEAPPATTPVITRPGKLALERAQESGDLLA